MDPGAPTRKKATQGCVCGFLGDSSIACRCREHEVRAYLSRLSGPMLDRIDLQVDVGRVATDELLADQPLPAGESERVRTRVIAARARALARLGDASGVFANAQLDIRLLRRHCALRGSTRTLLRAAAERLALTARSIHRVLKVARTIADLDCAAEIEERHLSEALQYRSLERALAQFKD